MQREHIMKIFGKGFAYALFGNLLSGIMVISIAPMISIWFVCLVAFLFTLFIYASLLFTAGYRDGQREISLIKNHRVEASPKYRWIIFGLIIGAVMAIPTVVLLMSRMGMLYITQEFMFAYRFLNGAAYPMFHIAGVQSAAVADYPAWFLPVCIAFYLILTPVAAQIGYKFGYDEKTRDSFMYEK